MTRPTGHELKAILDANIELLPWRQGLLVHAYVIIGKDSVGKSSLIRSLTGIRNDDQRLMSRLSGPDFQLWAKDSSLQEASISPQDFISQASVKTVDAVLFALLPGVRRSKGILYPDALGYLKAFQQAGWAIQPVVALTSGGNPPSVAVPANVRSAHFSNLHTNPFNSFVSSVRLHWGWN